MYPVVLPKKKSGDPEAAWFFRTIEFIDRSIPVGIPADSPGGTRF